jgi:hypothetical protein
MWPAASCPNPGAMDFGELKGVPMLNRRNLMSLIIISTCVLGAGQMALAKNPHHNNGHNLLGAKLNQDGKHEVGKAGKNSVSAEVKNKKVVNMSAGSLPVRKVKSNKKMAAINSIKLAANGEFKVAQADVYYAYCFDDGIDEYCYWYPASDVIVTDTWIEYTPT